MIESSSELPDNPGPTWWQRHFQRQHDQQVRQLEESQRQDQIRAALAAPFNPDDWQRQRELLGLDQHGTDNQVHGSLRRLS